jgi:purine-nucleoside phosphorylase
MPTPHNTAEIDQIAKTVFMCGDPLRAEYIAKNYLTDTQKVTEVRNMYGFTGKYDGKDVTVMGHGMGMPSIGIYTYELFNFYNVDSIIRIGSAAGLHDVNLRELVIGMAACTDSNFAWQYELPGTFARLRTSRFCKKRLPLLTSWASKSRGKYPLHRRVLQPDVRKRKVALDGRACGGNGSGGLYMNAAKAGKKRCVSAPFPTICSSRKSSRWRKGRPVSTI